MILTTILTLFIQTPASASLPSRLPDADYTPVEQKYKMVLPKGQEQKLRNQALKNAKIWSGSPSDVANAKLGESDHLPGSINFDEEVFCKFMPEKTADGTTPKFFCSRPGGEILKVKYNKGRAYPHGEIYTEVLGARLFHALGAPANRMFLVKKIRCFGCSNDPYQEISTKLIKTGKANTRQNIDFNQYVDFNYVSVQKRMATQKIEATSDQGWAFPELNQIDVNVGATKADIDALRLLAVFINHVDSHPSNQALICTDEKIIGDGTCEKPVAIITDLGATFGSGYIENFGFSNLELGLWADKKIWDNQADCSVSLKIIPNNGTFSNAKIGEAGRAFLAERLRQLSDNQIRDLFAGIHVEQIPFEKNQDRKVQNWVTAFKDKVEQITSRTCSGN